MAYEMSTEFAPVLRDRMHYFSTDPRWVGGGLLHGDFECRLLAETLPCVQRRPRWADLCHLFRIAARQGGSTARVSRSPPPARRSADTLTRVRGEVSELKNVMVDNIEKVRRGGGGTGGPVQLAVWGAGGT